MDLFQSNDTFWDILQSDTCAVPNYIKNILTFCNFGNVLSLQKLDNDDIINIEQMAKNEFKDWIDEQTHITNLVDYFGPIYHTKPQQFTFTCGDNKMIKQLSEYVQLTVRKKGYEYFQNKNRRCSQHSKRHGTDNRDLTEEELQDELFNGVLNLLQPYGDDVMSLFKKEMVEVTNENGQIKGLVHCVVCDTEKETGSKMKKRRKDFYSQYWNGQKWSLSNFANHHLNKVHPIMKNASKESNIDEENSQNSDSISSVGGLRNNSNIKHSIDKSIAGEPKETPLKTEPTDHGEFNEQPDILAANKLPEENDFYEEDSGSMAVHSILPLDPSNNSHAENPMIDKRIGDDDANASLIELKIEPVNVEFTVQLDILRAQLQFHNIQMTNTALQTREDGSECEIQLSDGIFSKIEVCRIPVNGNCLFGATVHQINKLKIGSNEYIQRVAELREEVVIHIKTNLHRFERLLLGRVYAKLCDKDENTKTQNVAEDSMSFLDNYLSKDTAWAGPEAIQAISEIFKANVVIFNEWGEVNCGNSFDSSYKDTISLAFRVSGKSNKKENVPNTQRNHYDSVIKISNDVLDKCASVLLSNYIKSCSIKQISHVIDIE